MTTKITNKNIDLTTINSVGTLTSLAVSGTSNFGAVGNITITGGTTGQLLTTNGSGGLSWTTVSGGGGSSSSSISNGASNVNIATSNGNVQIVANTYTMGNFWVDDYWYPQFGFDGKIFLKGTTNSTTYTGYEFGTVGSGHILPSRHRIASRRAANAFDSSMEIGVLADSSGWIPNIYVRQYSQDASGDWDTNSIVANLVLLDRNGLTTIPSLKVSGTSNLGPVGNVTITGGSDGQFLKTDGSGVLSWASSSATPGTNNVGYLNIPQNSQSSDYTMVLTDAGKHIYHPAADTTARTYTLPSNANVAYPLGSTVIFVNDSSGVNVTIAIDTDTLMMAGNGATGSRTLAANGMATAIKLASTKWIISGVGLT
jgi:hypothetical protein